MPQRVSLKTFDHVTIIGDWVPAPTTLGAAVLLHMMPDTRQSWAAFQGVLAERGIASLAIDLRGHGESTQSDQGVLAYKTFNESEHLNSLNDVRAAFEWIRTHGIEPGQIVLAGASIGANLALQFLTEEPQIPGAVLLSPGMAYHGVTAADAAERLLPHQGVWMAASQGDDDESVRAVKELDPMMEIEEKQIKLLQTHGHGTKILASDTALMAEAADWMRARIMAV